MKREALKSEGSRRVTLLLEAEQQQRLLERAAERSLAEGRPVGLSEVAREVVHLGLAVGPNVPREAA